MGNYNSIKLEKLYIAAAFLCGLYMVLSVLMYLLSGGIFGLFTGSGDDYVPVHPEMMISVQYGNTIWMMRSKWPQKPAALAKCSAEW